MMTEKEKKKLLEEFRSLPKGSVVRRHYADGLRYSHQWRENGTTFSEQIAADRVAELETKIRRRRELERRLKDAGALARRVKASVHRAAPARTEFECDVKTGRSLDNWAELAAGFEHRDKFALIMKYLRWRAEDRVCVLYGLRRTGKTTMLRQAVLELTGAERSRAAYIKARAGEGLDRINRDLRELERLGYRYVFIDEVTLMEDFIDGAAMFSDVFCGSGMKIVLSGTDSLGFWFSTQEALYDRAYMIHTTFIPYREHVRLLKTADIDEYIRFGGLLQAGELAFEDPDAMADDASFRDDESTRRYIDTAICRNIQHSLKCFEGGGHFRDLLELYRAGELTNAINRVIEDMNREFVAEVITRDFRSHDLGSAAQQLRSAKDKTIRNTVLDDIDRGKVTTKLMKLLEVRNVNDRRVGIRKAHVEELREYLEALDLIVPLPVRSAVSGSGDRVRILFSQPGMRFCQAQALVSALSRDAYFRRQDDKIRRIVEARILDDVRGRMLEDIVLLETAKAMQKSKNSKEVFKLQFAAGEYDMVIADEEDASVGIFEIKHSAVRDEGQCRYLRDRRCLEKTERLYGEVISRTVLYRGDDFDTPDGIHYRNVNRYLEALA